MRYTMYVEVENDDELAEIIAEFERMGIRVESVEPETHERDGGGLPAP